MFEVAFAPTVAKHLQYFPSLLASACVTHFNTVEKPHTT